jgi:N-acetylglucosamine-6-phosphate deacetylase
MARTWLHDAVLIDPEAPSVVPGCLLIEDDRILETFPAGAPRPESAAPISLGGRALAPGFIDLHYHGRLIFVPPAAIERELADAAKRMAAAGVTAFLPTTVAWPSDPLRSQVSAWTEACEASPAPGEAARLGLHLEGPWIRPEAAGAQPTAGIRPFDPSADLEILDRGEGRVRMVTLAPETEGAGDLLAELARRQIVASLGHSHAERAATLDAIEAGARHVTHLFNAMPSAHHRAPGLAGTALTDDRLSCDLICDGVHVHPDMVRLAALAKGSGLTLITDNVEPIPDAVDDAEISRHGGSRTMPGVFDDGTALRLPDGTLAGSSLSLDRALCNAIEFGAMSLQEAVQAVTSRPAALLGLEAERGTMRPGARADLVVLDSANQVVETWIGGARS